jgi:hypothetical protein
MSGIPGNKKETIFTELIMIRKTVFHALVLTFMLSLFLSLTMGSSSAKSVTPGVYHVYGRVLNQQDKPVADCNVMLVKSKPVAQEEKTAEGEEIEPKPDEIVSQEIVGITKTDGEYSFVFETLEGENFWIYFVTDGYRTRTMQMNKLMRSRFFQKPNKSPLRIEVILEKN